MTRARVRRAVLALMPVMTPLAAPVPAGAHPGTCAGVAQMLLSDPFFTPLGAAETTSLQLRFAGGSCTPGMALTPDLAGSLTGWCDAAGGDGQSNEHHAFDVEWRAGTLTLTGDVVGSLTVTADAMSGNSCLFGARYFTAAGTVTVLS